LVAGVGFEPTAFGL